METIKKRFQYLLNSKHITPYRLAKNTQVSAATYSRILTQDNTPNTSTISVICNYFNCNENWLTNGEGPIYKNETTNTEERITRLEKSLKNTQKDIFRLMRIISGLDDEKKEL